MDPFILSLVEISVLAAVLLAVISFLFFVVRKFRNRKDPPGSQRTH